MKATSQSFISSGLDHMKILNENFLSSLFDHSCKMNDSSVSSSNTDLFGLPTLRSAPLVNPSRQSTPSILNLTADEHLQTNTPDVCGLESPIMNMANRTELLQGYGCSSKVCGFSPKDDRSPKLSPDFSRIPRNGGSPPAEDTWSPKLKLDFSRIPNRNNGSSPPFSDSSLSTSSSNLDTGFFPPCLRTGRSDSPNSEGSNSSSESTSNRANNFSFPPMTDQELANLQNLHVISCMQSMSKEQFMQTISMISTVLLNNNNNNTNNNSPNVNEISDSLELEARHHRNAAVSGNATAQFTWSGVLPKRSYKGPYSSKVFIGGVPWEAEEQMLIYSFQQFGNVKVEWPGKDSISQPKGYVYIIFENDLQVKMLLDSCREGYDEENGGSYFYKIPSRKSSKPKDVQVIPWSIIDSNYSVNAYQKLDPLKTVFVGALHGMLTAEGLFHVMDDLFGGVIYAGIDTDKDKYPIGSGRVVFNNYKSYVKAVTAAFVDIKTPKFKKKVQVDPYLEDTPCSSCHIRMGPYFCRENGCFCYFCRKCWISHHLPMRTQHRPLIRNSNKHGPLTNAVVSSFH